MTSRALRLMSVAALIVAASCSNGASSATPNVAPANIAAEAKLQFGVGTATIGYPGGSVTGTNFVATFRGTNGHSATLVNTPTITGPKGFAIGFPGSSNTIGGILPNVFDQAVLAVTNKQTQALPAAFYSTLGPYVGVFGYGMAGDNLLSSQVALDYQKYSLTLSPPCYDMSGVGTGEGLSSPSISVGNVQLNITSEAQSNELPLPVGYGQGPFGSNGPSGQGTAACPLSPLSGVPVTNTPVGSAVASLPINYYGGPPAWPSGQGYGQPDFFVGYPLGFIDFAATPVVGSYSLDVAYPTNASATTYGHFEATAALRNINPLPPITISSATINSDLTGSVSVNVPVGVTEAIVLIRTACAAASTNAIGASNYAIVTHAVGAQTLLFSAKLGPPDSTGTPTATFCPAQSQSGGTGGTAYVATAYAVGFDYPAYESSYPFNVAPTPQITNAMGQADVTTSAPASFTGP